MSYSYNKNELFIYYKNIQKMSYSYIYTKKGFIHTKKLFMKKRSYSYTKKKFFYSYHDIQKG